MHYVLTCIEIVPTSGIHMDKIWQNGTYSYVLGTSTYQYSDMSVYTVMYSYIAVDVSTYWYVLPVLPGVNTVSTATSQ